jgi:hypothetical protein
MHVFCCPWSLLFTYLNTSLCTLFTTGQGMQALLDLLFAVEGSVSDAAKILG